jgi:hypothetical protein
MVVLFLPKNGSRARVDNFSSKDEAGWIFRLP